MFSIAYSLVLVLFIFILHIVILSLFNIKVVLVNDAFIPLIIIFPVFMLTFELIVNLPLNIIILSSSIPISSSLNMYESMSSEVIITLFCFVVLSISIFVVFFDISGFAYNIIFLSLTVICVFNLFVVMYGLCPI